MDDRTRTGLHVAAVTLRDSDLAPHVKMNVADDIWRRVVDEQQDVVEVVSEELDALGFVEWMK